MDFSAYLSRTPSRGFCGSHCIAVLSGPYLGFVDQAKSDRSSHSYFHSDCLDSFQSLPITTAESLRFAQPPLFPFTGAFRPQSCTRLLQQMVSLQEIILDSSTAPRFVRAPKPVDGDIPCPKLQVLIVIQREHYEADLLNSLVALSNQRRDHGCRLACLVGSPGLWNWREIV